MSEPPAYDFGALFEMSQRELGQWFPSRYDGWCRGCGAPVAAGDMIRWYAPEDGYLGTCCGGDAAG